MALPDKLPDFLIIGAMKCGTSTLHAQLAAQPGIFMATPKEPNFFSDDAVYARGLDWYRGLFAPARPGDLKGEASTHYTKLPTYPLTVARMQATLTAPKLIYLVRNPVARAVSHFIHGWTLGEMPRDLGAALRTRPELVDYGRYAMQIVPYMQAFGRDRILLVSLEQMERAPQTELARVGAFLGLPATPRWQEAAGRANASAERIRRFPFSTQLIEHPLAVKLRRALVPRSVRAMIRHRLQMRTRPVLPNDLASALECRFVGDHAALCALFPETDFSASYPFLAAPERAGA